MTTQSALRRRGGRFQLYLPLVVLLVGQAAFVALLPSRGDRTVSSAAFESNGTELDEAYGAPTDEGGSGSGATGPAGGNSGSAGPGARPGTSRTTPPPGSPGSPEASKGDTSHCTPDGRQDDISVHVPPCAPKFRGNNGGATASGVTGNEIRVMIFKPKLDPQYQTVLEGIGLSDPAEVKRAFIDAAAKYLNEQYEFYGRKIVVTEMESECPTAPYDEDSCRASVQEAIRRQPFMLYWGDYGYPNQLGELARAGIITHDLGGTFAKSHFETFAPYRWAWWMDGTQTAEVASEYYCKALAGGKATHSGPLIHERVGVRGEVDRKVGIVSVEYGPFRAAADQLSRRLQERCGVPSAPVFTYSFDTNSLPQQCQAITSGLINAGVTTVLWSGEFSGPLFCTPLMTGQKYFPENVLAGGSYIDADSLARLNDQQQWKHAFGVSIIPNLGRWDEGEEAEIWRRTGHTEAYSCRSCSADWAYLRTFGMMIQVAGPTLTATNVQRGMFAKPPTGGWETTGGDATIELLDFGPGDYTGVGDWREVWWDPNGVSSGDGSDGGAYVAVEGGRRYRPGQYTRRRLEVPVPPT